MRLLTRKIWIAPALVALLAGGAMYNRSFGQQKEELDAVKLAPEFNKLLFENAFVRVSSERLPVGKALPKHQHKRGMAIAIVDYQIEQKVFPTGEVIRSNRHVGDVTWTDGVIHEAHNTGKTDQYAVRVELK